MFGEYLNSFTTVNFSEDANRNLLSVGVLGFFPLFSTFFSFLSVGATVKAPEHGTPKKFLEYFWEMKLAVWGGNNWWRWFLFTVDMTQTWKRIVEVMADGNLRMNQRSHNKQEQKKPGLW